MERILIMAMETWGICVYYVIEVHSVIIIITNKSSYQWILKQWNHCIPF